MHAGWQLSVVTQGTAMREQVSRVGSDEDDDSDDAAEDDVPLTVSQSNCCVLVLERTNIMKPYGGAFT